MNSIATGIGSILIVAGSFFVVVGAVGLMRMPDLFTRMHAASVADTLGASLLLTGFMFYAGFSLVTLKLAFLFFLFFFIGPVASHAIANAALHYGIEPPLVADRRSRLDASEPPQRESARAPAVGE